MQPLVSILIPAYNAERWLAQTLQSAIGQDYPVKEVIVVDDGSSDRTLDVARAFASPSVKVVHQANAGAPAARNAALGLAQGDFVQWLDCDDVLGTRKLSLQIAEWERLGDDRVLLSGPFATFYHRIEKARLRHNRLCRDLTPQQYFQFKFSEDDFLQTSCWLVSRKLGDLAGPWWELRSPDDDGEYFCRIAACASAIRYVPDARCFYRVGDSSLSVAWRRSRSSLHALFQSTSRSIDHYLKLENSVQSRAACVAFLQKRLIYFFPDSPQIVERMYELAGSLGGELQEPDLPPQYRLVKSVLGWHAAKAAMRRMHGLRGTMNGRWDRFLSQAPYREEFDLIV